MYINLQKCIKSNFIHFRMNLNLNQRTTKLLIHFFTTLFITSTLISQITSLIYNAIIAVYKILI